jgi:hypothetical protein
MEMKPKRQLQEKLKEELKLLTNHELSDSNAWEALFNLSGFFRVLKQMKKEANYGKTV